MRLRRPCKPSPTWPRSPKTTWSGTCSQATSRCGAPGNCNRSLSPTPQFALSLLSVAIISLSSSGAVRIGLAAAGQAPDARASVTALPLPPLPRSCSTTGITCTCAPSTKTTKGSRTGATCCGCGSPLGKAARWTRHVSAQPGRPPTPAIAVAQPPTDKIMPCGSGARGEASPLPCHCRLTPCQRACARRLRQRKAWAPPGRLQGRRPGQGAAGRGVMISFCGVANSGRGWQHALLAFQTGHHWSRLASAVPPAGNPSTPAGGSAASSDKGNCNCRT